MEFRIDDPISNHYQYFKQRLEGFRFDAIAGVPQRWTENLICDFISNWIEETGLKNVVFSGGVALNIKASKRVSELDSVDDMFVSIAGGDESTSVGAAQFLWTQSQSSKMLQPITIPFLSPRFEKVDLEDALQHPFVVANYVIEENVVTSRVAQIISEGFVVGRMHGCMEFGPRALGNRSLLADPRRQEVVATINETIKNRDFWMPFTPSILADYVDEYLVNPKNLSSPYMAMAFDITEKAERDLAAAIHSFDKTVRPQIVTEQMCLDYFQLLKEFSRLTGVGALLNTSFNIHGKPIVYKPLDAVEEVLMHDLVNLSYVLIDDTLLIKR